jgi:hypothetical protein
VNRENTRYASEALGSVNFGVNVVGGWYESDKVRFRAGTPEKIGGWQRISGNTFLGICRSIWNWVTLAGLNLLGLGTNLKFYIENGGAYYDITPIRRGAVLNGPFTTNGTTTVTVTDNSHGCVTGDFVTFSNATTVSGLNLNGEYQVTVTGTNTYTITASSAASGSTSGGGGSYVNALYQVNVGPEYQIPLVGWGAGAWSAGTWGVGGTSSSTLRIWSQANFGQDLVYGYRGGPMYYWNAYTGYEKVTASITQTNPGVLTATIAFFNGMAVQLTSSGRLPTNLSPGTTYYVINASGSTCNLATTPGGTAIDTSGAISSGTAYVIPNGIPVSQLNGALSVPLYQNLIFISDTSRFVFCMGTNDYGSSILDPMLIRWSDQESVTDWSPAATNQAGSVRLSHGSEIIAAVQTRQEILVFTDSALYSLQYLGPPVVWGSQLLGDNISIEGENSAVIASGVVYWMGVDKFYKYDGRVSTLRCDLRQYIFSDINQSQSQQFFAGTNEGFNEVWWFYCSANSTTIDKYVVYNYLEDIWYYGNMARTAWLDSGLRDYPCAATYTKNIVNHEQGNDDNETATATPIYSVISSSEFDIEDGHNFGFIYRVLPDLTFRNSTSGTTPQVTMTLIPLQNSGAGYNNPQSEGGVNYATIQRIATAPVEEFTGQVFIRVRGRQLVFKVEGEQLGLSWQLGAPRIDIKPDGRRGNS